MQITSDILDLTDISEDESYQLHKACQMLFELADLLLLGIGTTKESHHQASVVMPHTHAHTEANHTGDDTGTTRSLRSKLDQVPPASGTAGVELCRYYATIPYPSARCIFAR